MELLRFVESKIDSYAQQIIDKKDKLDELSVGELNFYISLRKVLKGRSSPEDIGLMDGINDTLQFLGVLAKDKVFYR